MRTKFFTAILGWAILSFNAVYANVEIEDSNVLFQGGCTDPAACNFNPAATEDDGTCFYGNCDFYAANDVICINDGDPVNYNVLCNDGFPQGTQPSVLQIGYDDCFYIDDLGDIYLNPDAEDCCGEHFLSYELCDPLGGPCFVADVMITVKCGKPNCSLFNLEEYMSDDNGLPPGLGRCLDVCENSITTLYVPYNSNNTYVWYPPIGGSGVIGSNPAEYIVTWGSYGSGSFTLEIIDAANNSTFHDFCVNILEGPTANFTSDGYVCLGSSLCFTNLSTNDDSWHWDFGDGNYSTQEHPCHAYNTPGTFNVTLTAFKANFDPLGNPLCCCTDTIQMEVLVDSLPGPKIYWISTLCEGDSSKYWTDATNCTNYTWTVKDANGIDVTFDGQGNDTICLAWSIGPIGTISLDVDGCDSTYCDNPTTVTIPIIPSISQIQGPTTVCENTTANYTLPKWLSTYYDWQVTGGTLSSPNGQHSATITWGPAGVGTIHVDYYSDFLNGLPNHTGSECSGSADLTVDILPAYSLFNYGPSTMCVGQSSTIEAISSLTPNCSWTITPSVPFTGDNTNIINIDWNVAPGSYQICATPLTPSDYCNGPVCLTIRVIEIPPPTGITGPNEICPGDTTFYTATSSLSNVTFYWSAVNGTPQSSFGNTVGIEWNNSGGPYSVTVYQQQNNSPFCISDTITLIVNPKLIIGPLDILPGTACTNTLENYNMVPAQHPDAIITWSVIPSEAGSVIIQGLQNTQIQWNNTSGFATIRVDVELCGQSDFATEVIDVKAPIVPVITQTGILCPGVNATLSTTASFNAYSWSTGDTTPTTTISTAGTYTVTTTDINNCMATASFQANEVPGPTASISSGDNPVICIPSPHNVEIVALYQAGYEYEWFCNSASQGPPSPTSTFNHPFQGIPGTYVYYVIVTDTNTGCQDTSNTFTVTETDVCGGDPDCVPEPYIFDITTVDPRFPDCNIVDFDVNMLNSNFTQWTFGDGNISGSATTSHTYTTAACYYITASGFVPELGNPGSFCPVFRDTSVCVPVAADFDFAYIGCDTVQFQNFSTYLNIDPNNVITSYFWNFGFGTSTLENPQFVFPSPGLHPVTLTVTTLGGCTASITYNVFIDSVGTPSITVSPGPYCVGDPILFSASAVGASSYFWDFDDLATFIGQNPTHTYVAPNTYNVQVTASNADGCSASANVLITVHPAVPEEVITANPGLTICQGETTVLSAPAGYTYLWSNLATTQSITVGAGTYSVTITDGNGCSSDLDPVTVVELPLPTAIISGKLFICDAGCVTLDGTSAVGSTYQWLDDVGSPIPFETNPTIVVCDFNLLPGYSIQVTDINGCVNISAQVVVSVATSPSFSISVVPNGCEGTLNTLTVTPTQPNVVYSWSNGDTGPVTMTSQAGTYVALGMDTISGCSSSASAIIHPLPDLCIVPAGCYEACNPDTICGPAGLSAYQWNMNGSPISGETSQCLIVTQSGEYSLTGTTSFGCVDTSDPLILTLIDCEGDCDNLSIDYSFLIDADNNVDSCCYVINYVNNYGLDLKGLSISTLDADFVVDVSTVHPSLNLQSITSNSLDLTAATAGDPIPTGNLNGAVTICLSNVINDPQLIVIDWYDFNDDVVCQDTLFFHCPVEPDCLYLQNDSIYCENGLTFYQFTLCNPHDAEFSVGYFSMNATAPAGIVVTPPDFDISGTPILPGNCDTFLVQLSGPAIGGDTLCYQLLAHEFNPNLEPDALCCSLDTTYYVPIPECDPCNMLGIEFVETLNEEDCCYSVSLYNNYDPTYFDEIGVCVISPMTTITVNNPINSGWITSGYTPTAFSLLPGSGFGNHVPGGVFTIPEICIQTATAPNQLVELKWIKDGVVVCRDTLSLFCEPDCGYILNETIECGQNDWLYTFDLKNTSTVTVEEAHIHFSDPNLTVYDQIVNLGSLSPGGIFGPINLNIGSIANAGDTICFTVTLHEISADGLYLTCCNFTHCIVLPDCPFEDCQCDEEFYDAVNTGFTWTPTGNPFTYSFVPIQAQEFGECDQVRWKFGDNTQGFTTGGESIIHTYPGPGTYVVCYKVTRTLPDGTICSQGKCVNIMVGVNGFQNSMIIYPNPNEGVFEIGMTKSFANEPIQIEIYDNTQRNIYSGTLISNESRNQIKVDLRGHAKGIYFVHFRLGEELVIKKVVIF